jgi:hypothetical protein
MQKTASVLPQDQWHKIKKARQRLVLCRLMIDVMRTVHGAYAPLSEPFGTRLETFFIGLCVALGDIEGEAIFCRQDCCVYARAPHDSDTQAQAVAKLGAD